MSQFSHSSRQKEKKKKMRVTQNRQPIVAVIGAGVTGAITALAFTEAGYDVVVFEKGTIGNGSSQRSAACMRAQFHTEATVRGMVYAERFYTEFASRYHCDQMCHQNGYLYPYRDPDLFAEATARVAQQKNWGLSAVEILSPADIQKKFPQMASGIIGATWCPTDGFLSHDTIYNQAIHRAKTTGAGILQYTSVIGAKRKAGRITHLTTEKGSFPVDWVINATNAWTPRLAQAIGGQTLPIRPVKRYLWFLNPGSQDVTNWPMVVSESPRLKEIISDGVRECLTKFVKTDDGRISPPYCRPDRAGNLLMMGWANEYAESEDNFTDSDQDEIRPGNKHTDPDGWGVGAWQELAKWIPSLFTDDQRVGLTATTCGFYAITPDHNPFIDIDPKIPNMVHATGFSGHGLMHAPFTARIVQHLIKEGKDVDFVLDGAKINLDRFKIGREYKKEAGSI